MRRLWVSLQDALMAVLIVFVAVFVCEFVIAFRHFWNPQMSTQAPIAVFEPPSQVEHSTEIPGSNSDEAVEKLKTLRLRTNLLANQILDFVYDREGTINDWKQQAIAQAFLDAIDNVDNKARFQAGLRARNDETQDRFLKYYWPQVVSLENDLSAAGVDLSPIERAVALDGPRKVGFMLSVLTSRIGRKAPYERVLTPIEARVMIQGSLLPSVQVYASSDSNSREVAEVLRKEIKKQGASVNDKLYPLLSSLDAHAGISLIYPSADWTTELNNLIPAFEECELETSWGVVPLKQPPSILKIEVRPQSPQWFPHTGPASLIISKRNPHNP